MTYQRGVVAQSVISCAMLLVAACSDNSTASGSNGGAQGGQSITSGSGTGGTTIVSGSGGVTQVGGASSGGSQTSSQATGGKATTTSTGGQSGTSTGVQGGTTSTSGKSGGTTSTNATGGTTSSSGGTTSSSGGTASSTGGAAVAVAGMAGGPGAGGSTALGGTTSGTAGNGAVVSSCANGKAWPTANPGAAGPFQVAADKNVGPLAGYTPDPIYADQQQRFNIYRPKNLADSGYCHPILVWANGHTDNPEPNPPLCVVDSGANKWCGQYLPMMNHLASHGFVVIASLSTTTSMGTPLPTIAGLNWLLQQAEDSTSPYYHRLDTANIGQLGHSEGAMSTCMVASEPRYKALMPICGTRALTGVHTPMLFFCGGKDSVVSCSGVRDVFLTVTNQPAFFMNEKNADHGSWVYGGANSPSLSGAAAWFRVHLMGDTANRKYFYGSGCTFCSDSRVTAEQNSLMAQ